MFNYQIENSSNRTIDDILDYSKYISIEERNDFKKVILHLFPYLINLNNGINICLQCYNENKESYRVITISVGNFGEDKIHEVNYYKAINLLTLRKGYYELLMDNSEEVGNGREKWYLKDKLDKMLEIKPEREKSIKI